MSCVVPATGVDGHRRHDDGYRLTEDADEVLVAIDAAHSELITPRASCSVDGVAA